MKHGGSHKTKFHLIKSTNITKARQKCPHCLLKLFNCSYLVEIQEIGLTQKFYETAPTQIYSGPYNGVVEMHQNSIFIRRKCVYVYLTTHFAKTSVVSEMHRHELKHLRSPSPTAVLWNSIFYSAPYQYSQI